jgi:hypothetical protein
MNKIRQLFIWLLVDTFPLSLSPFLIIVHLFLLRFYPDESERINRVASNMLQAFALVVVFMSVSDNLEVINRGSLSRMFIEWLNAFPLRKRNVTVHVNGMGSLTAFGTARVRVIPKTETLEEKVAFLFDEVNRLQEEMNGAEQRLNVGVETLKKALEEAKASQASTLAELEGRLSDVFVGGTKDQLFGIACILHSLIAAML